MTQKVLIVGGGHAAAQLCSSLVEGGFDGQITMVSEEASLPYHRPPLSKAFLKDPAVGPQLLRAEAVYADAGIQVVLGEAVTHIDHAQKRATLSSQKTLDYDVLVLATGTRARRLPALPETLRNVVYLRNVGDAVRLRESLNAAQHVTVLGGGFIGLEVAATAAHLGKQVEVFEASPRLMQRAVSPEISQHVAELLQAAGVQLRLSSAVGHFEIEGDIVKAFQADGERREVELLLVGVGATAETTLAESLGVACQNGVVVDEQMRSSVAGIYAIGDCTVFPYKSGMATRSLRLESIQNANDQAKTLALTLLGKGIDHDALPWFWSEQGTMRLQIAGLAPVEAERVVRMSAKPGSFSVLHFVDDLLVCAESINAPVEHMAARKVLLDPTAFNKADLCDSTLPLGKKR